MESERQSISLCYVILLKNMIKGTVEQTDEEIHKARSRRSWVQDLWFLWSWGVSPSQCVDVFTHWKLSKPHTIRISVVGSWCGHYWSLTPFSAFLSSHENREVAENSKLLIMTGLSSDWPSTRSHPGAHPDYPHWKRRHPSHPENYKDFRSRTLCQEQGPKKKY